MRTRRCKERRRFIAAAGGLLVARLAAAQLPGRIYRVGWLGSGVPPAPSRNVSLLAFIERMRELGYVAGRNLVVEQRYGEGKPELTAERAAELVRIPVDVILATTTTATVAAKAATRNIPIVMGSAANPLAQGLVESLARPGGNITGLTLETADTTAKRLELLKAAVGRLRGVAAMYPGEARSFAVVAQWVKDNESAARELGISLTAVDLPQTRPERWDEVFRRAAADGMNAATIMETPTYLAYRARLAELCLEHRMPSIFPFREQAEEGGLMAYGADLAALYRIAAEYVDRVLKGARPADMPVQQPTKFIFVVNLRTAKALGLKIPQAVLVRADRVIE